MQFAKNKTMGTLISMVLMTIMVTSTLAIFPIATGQTSSPTHAFITVSPNPVGVGQSMFVAMWLIEMNPTSSANQHNVWHNYTLTVTKPDNTTERLVKDANSAASQNFIYIPDQIGTYHFKFDFPGEQITTSSVNNYYEPSSAETTSFVQQDPISALPQNPLPTDYWQRPVNWQNQFWFPITGNWFGDIKFWDISATGYSQGINTDTEAPGSAHVLWTFPITSGGQIGGEMYSETALSNYFTGKSYKQFWYPPTIINGVLYYNDPLGVRPNNGVTARNLRTGEIIWRNEELADFQFGTVYSEHNPNEVGGWPYLWSTGSTYTMWDANTGRKILDITGMSGTPILNRNGELLVYRIQAINTTHGFLSMWNSSQGTGSSGTNPWTSWSYDPPIGATLTNAKGIQWNVTVPIFPQSGTSVSIQYINDGVVMIAGTQSIQDYQTEAGYDATDGHYLWNMNNTLPDTKQQTNAERMMGAAYGVYFEHAKTAGIYYAFDIHTGAQLWETEPDPNAWNAFVRNGISDGNIFIAYGSASLRAYSVGDGSLVWEFFAEPAGLQTSTPTYPFEGVYSNLVAGGLTFAFAANSHGDQLFRGAKMYAINMSTGKEEWSAVGFFGESHAGGHAIADGIFVGHNMYDNQIYIIGKGRSATTVSAPTTVQTLGSQVLLQGTVTDQSPGDTSLGIPAAGTPAISDASMTEWMAYLYQQQPKPNNATGVPVSLDTIDPNGNFVHIGDTTSDAAGTYSYVWTPEISGKYTIIASFAGSKSYFMSSSETALAVTEAAPTSSPYPVVNAPSTEMYFVISTIAIIIAIAIVGLILLRKKP